MSQVVLPRKDFIQSLTDAIMTKGPHGRLQSRDYQLMRFILEQKFCSLEAIYFRFFDVRTAADAALPKNLWTTRQRLRKLRNLLLIKTEKVLSSGRAHFLLTAYGHKVLSMHSQDVINIKPSKDIDFSLYEHDSCITMIRALTESKAKCTSWYSEKWLKAGAISIGKNTFHFAKDIRPDAFFTNSKGERLALELEVSRKARSRIISKIALYDELLEENYRKGSDTKFRVVDKVWFIATKPALARFLGKLIEQHSRHQICYRVDLYDRIVPESAR